MENEQVRIIQLMKMLRDGAASMVLHQVGAAPDPNPRRGPPSTTDGDSVRGRASIRQSKATGHKDSTDTLRMMQWHAEGIYKKKVELTNVLQENKIDIICAQETHMNKENCCCHYLGYSCRLAARDLLYSPSHRQDSTYHGLCNTRCGSLAGTRNTSMVSPHEGSLRRPIAP